MGLRVMSQIKKRIDLRRIQQHTVGRNHVSIKFDREAEYDEADGATDTEVQAVIRAFMLHETMDLG
jgi:hypothetical protein